MAEVHWRTEALRDVADDAAFALGEVHAHLDARCVGVGDRRGAAIAPVHGWALRLQGSEGLGAGSGAPAGEPQLPRCVAATERHLEALRGDFDAEAPGVPRRHGIEAVPLLGEQSHEDVQPAGRGSGRCPPRRGGSCTAAVRCGRRAAGRASSAGPGSARPDAEPGCRRPRSAGGDPDSRGCRTVAGPARGGGRRSSW